MGIKNLSLGPGKNLTAGVDKNLILGTFFSPRVRGTAKNTRPYSHRLRGMHRSADDTLDRYELFQRTDADPDFSAPVDSGDSPLSVVLAPAAPGTTVEYRFALRDRNQYNLSSQNMYTGSASDAASFSIVIDENGDEVVVIPTVPFDEVASPSAAGTVTIGALYSYTSDGVDAADQWVLFITTDGTDAVVGVTPETVVPTVTVGAFATLEHITAEFVTGTVVKAIVVARRSGAGGADSPGTSIVTATANTVGPDQPVGLPFFGTIGAQEQ